VENCREGKKRKKRRLAPVTRGRSGEVIALLEKVLAFRGKGPTGRERSRSRSREKEKKREGVYDRR